LPDLRIVNQKPTVAAHVVRIEGGNELEELKVCVASLHGHRQRDAPDVLAARGAPHGGLYLVAPERPECPPLARDVGDGEAGLLQKALPNVDVVDLASDGKPIHGCAPRRRVTPRHPGERIRVVQVCEGADDLGEVRQPIVCGPWADVVRQQDTEDEVRWLSSLDAATILSGSSLSVGWASSTCFPLPCSKAAMISLSASPSWS
jgi:hypothetical protein